MKLRRVRAEFALIVAWERWRASVARLRKTLKNRHR